MSNSSSGATAYVLLAFLIVMSILRRRGVRQSKSSSLNKGERQRPILMTWLDPLLSILFIGSVLWGLVTRNYGHFACAIVGALAGIPVGMARANTMYVRAIPDAKSVIFRRSTLEYGLLALLLALRIVEGSIAKLHNGVATYVLTALIALAVAESIARTLAIGIRYHRESRLPGATTTLPPGGA